MPPGKTSRPVASISRPAPSIFSASWMMRPSLMPTSHRTISEAVTTVPPRMARSSVIRLFLSSSVEGSKRPVRPLNQIVGVAAEHGNHFARGLKSGCCGGFHIWKVEVVAGERDSAERRGQRGLESGAAGERIGRAGIPAADDDFAHDPAAFGKFRDEIGGKRRFDRGIGPLTKSFGPLGPPE